jgi:peptidoglycan-associated lipoprotein
MNRSLVLCLFAALLVAGCSKTKKDEPAATVDKGTGKDSGAQTYSAGQDGGGKASELDNPTGPLSVRVIYFDYDSSEIAAQYRGAVDAHAAFLAKNSGRTVTLEGHADERGSREYNLALGERRAQSVRNMMTLQGVAATQVRTTSYGEERPAAEGSDENAWSQNRRVEIIY